METKLWTLLTISTLCLLLEVKLIGAKDDCSDKSGQGNKDKSLDPKFSQDLNNFALRLYSQVAQGTKSNIFFAPGSISMALGMLYEGASGKTREQMKQQLYPSMNEGNPSIANEHSSLNSELLKEKTKYKLEIANGLFVDSGYPVLDSFQDKLKACFKAEAENVKFATEPEKERIKINEWAENNTLGKIKDLIPKDAITAETKAVLANAMYFKAQWDQPFDTSSEDGEFTKIDGSKVKVKMLTKRVKETLKEHPYYTDDQVKVFGLPYYQGELDFFIIMPSSNEHFATLEKSFQNGAEKFAELVEKAEKEPQVMKLIQIPKFEIVNNVPLKDQLVAMGLNTMFEKQSAEFANINPTFYLTDAFHQAFIKINENGTEAAAATGAVGGWRTLPRAADKEFIADRPFTFAVKHRDTRQILFMGRISTFPEPGSTKALNTLPID